MSNAIQDFWAWWPSARPRIADAITSGQWDELAGEIAVRVHAIDPELDWEIGPGRRSAHAFNLAPHGDSTLRRTTERWLAAAPPPDADWEFHPARQGNPEHGSLVLELEGHKIEFAAFTVSFEVDDTRERVDGIFHHPLFATMEDRQRATATFLLVDGCLGEDGVERWLGAIETSVAPLADGQPIAALLGAVDELAAAATGEQFEALRGEVNDDPIFIICNRALKRVDHLACDMSVEITVRLRDPNDQGLPSNDEADSLNTMEDELLAALGDRVAYLGRETRRGVRRIQLFAPELGPEAAAIEAWSQAHAAYTIEVAWSHDPTWEHLHRWD